MNRIFRDAKYTSLKYFHIQFIEEYMELKLGSEDLSWKTLRRHTEKK